MYNSMHKTDILLKVHILHIIIIFIFIIAPLI